MSRAQVIEADLTWTEEGFRGGVRIEVGHDGRIARVGELDTQPTRRLRGKALLPGFVDAHSHAFQRGLRGLGERFPAGAGSFWSWREAMYGLVEELDREALRRLSLRAFREMRRAGITAVGEFHYLHHADPRARDFALDEEVLAAAAEAGIRLVLLEAYYRTGGIGRPLEGAQLRFATPDRESYWRQMDRLAGLLDPELQRLGTVVHSLRAATPEEVAELYGEAHRRGLPFHMHVEEQRREIEEVVAAYGRRPMTILTEELLLTSGFTAVHCTHTEPAELAGFVAAGGHICVCPLTEANLGDGIPPLAATDEATFRLCLGSDSNARISMVEEMRWLEYGQRLAGEQRGVLRDEAGGVAPVLLEAATRSGARSLGLDAGAIEAGRWADFALLDLASPTLAEADAATLLDAFLFGGGDEAIAATCVGGRWQEHRG